MNASGVNKTGWASNLLGDAAEASPSPSSLADEISCRLFCFIVLGEDCATGGCPSTSTTKSIMLDIAFSESGDVICLCDLLSSSSKTGTGEVGTVTVTIFFIKILKVKANESKFSHKCLMMQFNLYTFRFTTLYIWTHLVVLYVIVTGMDCRLISFECCDASLIIASICIFVLFHIHVGMDFI